MTALQEVQGLDQVRTILETHRTIAVLGASTDRFRAGFYVPDYMHQHGYRILPVNPNHAGASLWGEPVRATLAELAGESVDILDVFRLPELLPRHLPEILAMRPRPRLVWLQQGIRNDEVAQALLAEGIAVAQDRCLLADHRRLGLGKFGE
ncbi:CoA-binding protein [Nannocystaceae bacterium ST9]